MRRALRNRSMTSIRAQRTEHETSTHSPPSRRSTAAIAVGSRTRRMVSELALMRYRVKVELAGSSTWRRPTIPELPAAAALPARTSALEAIEADFGAAKAHASRSSSATTNHDVKAVEYFVKEALREMPRSRRTSSSSTSRARRKTSTTSRTR